MEKLKEKIFGIIIVLALAIIFVPMLFDSKQSDLVADNKKAQTVIAEKSAPKPPAELNAAKQELQAHEESKAIEQNLESAFEKATSVAKAVLDNRDEHQTPTEATQPVTTEIAQNDIQKQTTENAENQAKLKAQADLALKEQQEKERQAQEAQALALKAQQEKERQAKEAEVLAFKDKQEKQRQAKEAEALALKDKQEKERQAQDAQALALKDKQEKERQAKEAQALALKAEQEKADQEKARQAEEPEMLALKAKEEEQQQQQEVAASQAQTQQSQDIEIKQKTISKQVREKVKSQANTSAAQRGGWIIQLGSFAVDAHASTLIKKLRNAGYPAYTRVRHSDGQKLTLVFVGPIVRKQEAQRLIHVFESKYEVSGIIKGYNPGR